MTNGHDEIEASRSDLLDRAPQTVRTRSFAHGGRIYDVSACISPRKPRTVTVAVTSNGKGIYYDYPEGVRTQQRHELTFVGDIDISHVETMNAVDYTMDDAEKLVRAWVA
jgi:hypothetical protein